MTDKMAVRYLSPVKSLMKKLDFDRHYIEALDYAIKNLKEKPQSKWIPVSERLPNESNGRVLITMREGKVTTGKHSEYSGNWYIGDMAQLANRPPIAWMPLPEAYKEAEE